MLSSSSSSYSSSSSSYCQLWHMYWEKKKKGFGWYKKTIEETLNWNQNKSLVYVVVVVIVELLLYTYCQRNDDEFYELLQNL